LLVTSATVTAVDVPFPFMTLFIRSQLHEDALMHCFDVAEAAIDDPASFGEFKDECASTVCDAMQTPVC
jgi:hypothetical protein